MSKLVSIEGRTRRSSVNKSVVDILRNWLEQAERGDLVALAICGVEPDGSTNTQVSESDHFHTLLSAVTILQFRLLDEARTPE
ncbi:MAG: hypothetical protein H6877_10195 [Rhodobiaceae bacterium]|nr:hypothetical protein [Rhodobiaceae bacterium]